MIGHAQFWADERLIYGVAIAAVATMFATIWLFRRRRRTGRQAGVICLIISLGLHAALVFLVPYLPDPNGGSATAQKAPEQIGVDTIEFSTFDPDMNFAESAGEETNAGVAPLPVSDLTDLLNETEQPIEPPPQEQITETPESVTATMSDQAKPVEPAQEVPESLATPGDLVATESLADIDKALGQWLNEDTAEDTFEEITKPVPDEEPPSQFAGDTRFVGDQPMTETKPITPPSASATAPAPKANIPGADKNDFANRTGQAKQKALQQTGGNAETEAAVEAALKFLAAAQRPDGAWDPIATGAGVERAPLGENRHGAGGKAESAITGLALLTLMGAGNTHQRGDYADNVYRGLAYLIRNQKPDGSLAGNASPYAATYSHGMASLALCEAAAITRDPSAVTAARRAIAYTTRMQHPTTGGWRYLPGDTGDLSQLGWQAMVLDAGYRADVAINPRSVAGVRRFLQSVRAGQGGLASYRRGEAPSRTMTAEALATRLLIGENVPDAEVKEAQRYLLQQPPGVGQDNYYYWYYATLALHQLQDDAWVTWNQSLQQRLLATQQSNGSWPTASVWGGYGGRVYTTSMAALCLETYYRHKLRKNQTRIAELK